MTPAVPTLARIQHLLISSEFLCRQNATISGLDCKESQSAISVQAAEPFLCCPSESTNGLNPFRLLELYCDHYSLLHYVTWETRFKCVLD